MRVCVEEEEGVSVRGRGSEGVCGEGGCVVREGVYTNEGRSVSMQGEFDIQV